MTSSSEARSGGAVSTSGRIQECAPRQPPRGSLPYDKQRPSLSRDSSLNPGTPLSSSRSERCLMCGLATARRSLGPPRGRVLRHQLDARPRVARDPRRARRDPPPIRHWAASAFTHAALLPGEDFPSHDLRSRHREGALHPGTSASRGAPHGCARSPTCCSSHAEREGATSAPACGCGFSKHAPSSRSSSIRAPSAWVPPPGPVRAWCPSAERWRRRPRPRSRGRQRARAPRR